MRIYVAGKYQEREFVRTIYDKLKLMGHSITVDWTNHDVLPEDDIKELLGKFAEEDIAGVTEADLLIAVLVNQHEYKGLWVEMGVALGLEKPVYILGSEGDSCIFANHPLVRKFNKLNELLVALGNEVPNFYSKG